MFKTKSGFGADVMGCLGNPNAPVAAGSCVLDTDLKNCIKTNSSGVDIPGYENTDRRNMGCCVENPPAGCIGKRAQSTSGCDISSVGGSPDDILYLNGVPYSGKSIKTCENCDKLFACGDSVNGRGKVCYNYTNVEGQCEQNAMYENINGVPDNTRCPNCKSTPSAPAPQPKQNIPTKNVPKPAQPSVLINNNQTQQNVPSAQMNTQDNGITGPKTPPPVVLKKDYTMLWIILGVIILLVLFFLLKRRKAKSFFGKMFKKW